MEWIERLNDAISYIEEHLTDEIDYEKLGHIACCSGLFEVRSRLRPCLLSICSHLQWTDDIFNENSPILPINKQKVITKEFVCP